LQIKNITRTGLAALFVAWSFDQLFWGRFPGVSFLIFTLLCLGAGLILTWTEKKRPQVPVLLLLIPILFFAFMTVVRLEPFTRLVSFGMAVGLMILLTLSWLGGGWWRYNIRDYFQNGFQWLGAVIARPAQTYARDRKTQAMIQEAEGPQNNRTTHRTILSFLLGLLLALPLLFLLGLLLASADPVFGREVRNLLEVLRLENLLEYGFRLVYILLLAYILTGVLLYALLSSGRERVSADATPMVPPFLAWVTAATILLSVNLLFLGFVAVQFRYFFGGVVNIGIDGLTYAEYARRGFAELVFVAFISLVLFLSLSAVTRRSPDWPRRIFSALGLGLVGLVLIMLGSAFQRLFLYESTFGFTRLRTYSHIFMVWLGMLLVAIIVLEIAGRLNYLPLTLIVVGIGFGASLALLNVDGFIARQNISRAARGHELDTIYITGLSDDSVPSLFALQESDGLPQAVQEQVGGILACKRALRGDDPRPESWPSFHLSHWQADQLYAAFQAELEGYQARQDDYYTWYVTAGDIEEPCTMNYYW
jgi:hypothetical protein